MEEVTIDSIQIEIQSNSTNAAKSLDALAGSLLERKKIHIVKITCVHYLDF